MCVTAQKDCVVNKYFCELINNYKNMTLKELEYLDSLASQQFEDLKHSFLTTHSKLEEGLVEVYDKIDKAESYSIDDFIVTPEIQYEEELRMYGHITFKLYTNSIFITSYSLFEYVFKRICVLNYNESKIKLSHLKGQGIHSYKSYVENVMDVSLASLEDDWKEIDRYRIIRNAIVHDYGESVSIPKSILDRFPDITMDGYVDSQFHINGTDFVLKFCFLSEKFIHQVVNIIQSKKYPPQ